MESQDTSLGMKIFKWSIRVVFFVVVIGLLRCIYIETGIFTVLVIFLILVELIGRRNIEEAIENAGYRVKNKEDEGV